MSGIYDFLRDLNKAVLIKYETLGMFFDDAMKKAIKDMEAEIVKKQKKYSERKPHQYSEQYKQTGRPNEEDMYHLELDADESMEIPLINEKILSIHKMRVINIFSDLEIEIKSLIQQAYPNTNKKNFHKWENISVFFNTKGVDFKNIDGYNEANQIRIVNNSIKHSNIPSDDVFAIPEFNGLENFTINSLNDFIKRCHKQTNYFLTKLSERIYEEKYEFDDERIKQLALEYKERMNKDVIKKFIEELNT